MTNIDIIGCDSGDWAGLYIDNHLIIEGHKITAEHVIKELSKIYAIRYATRDITDERMEDGLPEKLDELEDYE